MVPGGAFYAMCHVTFSRGRQGHIAMHRLLAMLHGQDIGVVVDHRNRNTLDNRIENLRAATKSQNQYNRLSQPRARSGYKGVSYHKGTGRWVARISADRIARHLGYFDSPEAAGKAYDVAAIELHGEFARLNFSPENHAVLA